MKNIFLLLFGLAVLSQSYCQIIISNDTVLDCEELMTLLDPDNETEVICLIKDVASLNTITVRVVGLDCENIIVGDNKELRIPSNVTLQLRDRNNFTLTGNGSISGEHFATSTISIGPDTDNEGTDILPAINLDNDCNGCEVSNLTITSSNGEDETIGVVIDENSENNELNAVRFLDINEGIEVNGDGNTFNDLEFFSTAIGDTNCDETDNEFAAITLNTSNNNTFTNLVHVRSQAAITFLFNGICDNNSLFNVTVEQEDSDCPDSDETDNPHFDPCIWINDVNSIGNFITTNLNHGRVIAGNESNADRLTLCQNNSISFFDDCDNAPICAGN